MIAYGMVYAAVVGLPIFLAATAGSAALRRYGRPERGVWLVALGLALMLPVAVLISPLGTSTGASGTRPATQSLVRNERSRFQTFSLYGSMKCSAMPSPKRQRTQPRKSVGALEPVIWRACHASK